MLQVFILLNKCFMYQHQSLLKKTGLINKHYKLQTSSSIKWNSVAERPGTSQYAASRGSRFDEVHVVVIDGDGTITANSGTILEKNLSLSKAKDAEFSLGSPSHYRKNIK